MDDISFFTPISEFEAVNLRIRSPSVVVVKIPRRIHIADACRWLYMHGYNNEHYVKDKKQHIFYQNYQVQDWIINKTEYENGIIVITQRYHLKNA